MKLKPWEVKCERDFQKLVIKRPFILRIECASLFFKMSYKIGYEQGFKDGTKEELRRQKIAYEKCCQKFGI